MSGGLPPDTAFFGVGNAGSALALVRDERLLYGLQRRDQTVDEDLFPSKPRLIEVVRCTARHVV